jgi:mannose-6-phosphate isomerase-like protein (cupin superfamily)
MVKAKFRAKNELDLLHLRPTSDSRTKSGSSIPPEDLRRCLAAARSNDPSLPHIGWVGDTYTILLAGKDTAGRFCLVDMHIPPAGGPPSHRHSFEQSFIFLEGEIEVAFRGVKSLRGAGEAVHIPIFLPTRLTSSRTRATHRHICCASARLSGRNGSLPKWAYQLQPGRPRPKLDETAQAEFKAKAEAARPEVQDRAATARVRRAREELWEF